MDSFVKTSFCVPIKCMNVQRTESYLLPLVVVQQPCQRAFELSCPFPNERQHPGLWASSWPLWSCGLEPEQHLICTHFQWNDPEAERDGERFFLSAIWNVLMSQLAVSTKWQDSQASELLEHICWCIESPNISSAGKAAHATVLSAGHLCFWKTAPKQPSDSNSKPTRQNPLFIMYVS